LPVANSAKQTLLIRKTMPVAIVILMLIGIVTKNAIALVVCAVEEMTFWGRRRVSDPWRLAQSAACSPRSRCLNFVPALLTIVDSFGSADLAGSSVALSVPQVNRRKR
jgi:hypothetical protein